MEQPVYDIAASEQEAHQGSPARLLIVDDHPVVRRGLRAILRSPQVQVVAEAGSGGEAVALAKRLRPDVVLMDVRMSDMDGITATRLIKRAVPSTAVVILTSFPDRQYLVSALEAGASGYLLKGAAAPVLLDAVRLVMNGGAALDSSLLSHVVNGAKENGQARARLAALTEREREVLRLIVMGLSNRGIAARVHYSVATVKATVRRITEKLAVENRAQAAILAVHAGFGPEAPEPEAPGGSPSPILLSLAKDEPRRASGPPS